MRTVIDPLLEVEAELRQGPGGARWRDQGDVDPGARGKPAAFVVDDAQAKRTGPPGLAHQGADLPLGTDPHPVRQGQGGYDRDRDRRGGEDENFPGHGDSRREVEFPPRSPAGHESGLGIFGSVPGIGREDMCFNRLRTLAPAARFG